MFKAGLSRYSFWLLLILGLVMEGVFFRFARIREMTGSGNDVFLYFGAAYAIYVLVVVYVVLFWDKSFFSPELIVGLAILFRLTLLFSPPVLSGDVYRYVWDGKVSNMGINPYRYAPESENLFGLRDDAIYPKINPKSARTLYPPLMQYIFRAVTFFHPSVTAMKAAFLFFDVATIFVLFLILRFLERSLAWALLYAWHPLAVIEFAGSGHSDAVPIFFLMLGIYFVIRTRSAWSGIFLSFSFLAKFIAVIFLPFVEDLRSRWKMNAVIFASFAAVALIAYYPFLDAGSYVFSGLKEYAGNWEFNSSLYSPLHEYLQKVFSNDPSPNVFLGWATENKARTAAKFILFAAGFCFFIGVWIQHIRKNYDAQKENVLRAFYLLLGALTLLNPTVHPWYIIWVLPFLCFFPNPAWILLSGTIFLSYSVLGDYAATTEIRLWEYLPFYVLLVGYFLWNFVTKRIKAHPPESAK
jgi:alpha-1,6-mannosyltransferase